MYIHVRQRRIAATAFAPARPCEHAPLKLASPAYTHQQLRTALKWPLHHILSVFVMRWEREHEFFSSQSKNIFASCPLTTSPRAAKRDT